MRLEATRRLQAKGTTGAQSRSGPGGFTLAGTGAAERSSATLQPAGVLGVDSLVMLQTVDETAERRRARQRGARLLDLLDRLKLDLLTGVLDPAQIERLKRLVAESDDPYAEPHLAELMRAIDLRAQVELAKLERQAPAPSSPSSTS